MSTLNNSNPLKSFIRENLSINNVFNMLSFLLQCKAYPTQEALLQRLDKNIQWESYKQSSVMKAMSARGRQTTPYHNIFTSVHDNSYSQSVRLEHIHVN